MCNCKRRAVRLAKKLGFELVTSTEVPPVLRYTTHRVRLDMALGSVKRHHFRLSLLALAARLLG